MDDYNPLGSTVHAPGTSDSVIARRLVVFVGASIILSCCTCRQTNFENTDVADVTVTDDCTKRA